MQACPLKVVGTFFEKRLYLIAAEVLAINIGGPLYHISATQFPEQVFVGAGHSEAAQDLFVVGMPGSKCSDNKTIYVALHSKGEKVLFDFKILLYLVQSWLCSFTGGYWCFRRCGLWWAECWQTV